MYSIYSSNAIIADDLSFIYSTKSINQNYLDFTTSFLNSGSMSARPVSGFITASIIYLAKYDDSIYFLGLLFFPLSVLVIYFVLRKILPEEIVCVFILFYAISIIGTSVQFSPIMLNSNIATIFYLLSIYCIIRKKNLIISAVLFLFSILSYEIFLPAILLNILIIKETKQKIIYAIMTFTLVLLYRKYIQSYLFTNSYQRDTVSNVFDVHRNLNIILWSGKIFMRDYFIAIYKSFGNLKKVNVLEWITALMISYGVFRVLRSFNYTLHLQTMKKIAKFSLFGFIISFGIFVFSTYKPSLFGFENRNLGAIRLFFTLLIVSILIITAGKNRWNKNVVIGMFSVSSFILILTNVGVKNAWIFANDFNNRVFKIIKVEIDKNKIEKGDICVDFDTHNVTKNNPNFVLREPVFFNNWESRELSSRNGIDEKKIKIYNSERYNGCQYKIFIKN